MPDIITLYFLVNLALLLLFLIGLGIVAITQEKLYFAVLGALLLGYMLFGKGIAYVGVAPLYISEMTLAIGCMTVVGRALLRKQISIGPLINLSAFVILLFLAWGAVRTIPYLPEFGMDALRDGVIWGYALVAFCVALLVVPTSLEKIFAIYGRLLPYILIALVICNLWVRYFPLPSLPGSPVPLLHLKAGDAGVHLAGIAAFLLLRLDRSYGKVYTKWQLWGLWLLWGMAWVLYGVIARSGLISALVGVGIAIILRPKQSQWLRPAVMVAVLLLALLIGDLTGVSQANSNLRRQLSFSQVTTNFTSLVGGAARADQVATIQWRVGWWQKIARYTFGGEYLLLGKGFGVNLAEDDDYVTYDNNQAMPNRHPHNVTMNILARSGIVGLALWVSFLLAFGWQLLKVTRRQDEAGKTAVWLLAYWLAFLLVAQADVFLEGPMGGVWFWALVGTIWVFVYRVSNVEAQDFVAPAWLTRKKAMALAATGVLLLTGISLPLLMTLGYLRMADSSAQAAISSNQPELLARADEYASQAIAYNHQIAGLINYRLGIAYQELQLYDNANDYYQLALQAGNLRNRLMADLLLRVAIYYEETGKRQEADDYLQRVLAMDSDQLPVTLAAKANFHLAMNLWQQDRDVLLARDYLEKSLLLEFDPVVLDRYLKLIATIRDLGGENNLQQALAMATFATEMHPKNTWTALLRCSVHLARRELDEATDWCLRSRDLSPNNYHSYAWLGLVYQKRELWEEALANFEMAASLTSDNSWTLSLADNARKMLAKF